ncbi:hypothetical protein ACJIZ3_006849 [Penstemon smallii]|uniref:Uncharacterized protein n=1 Tax=Penstemon smallii TaxID=265156 RepID=A0ABD3S8U5_9LAMI
MADGGGRKYSCKTASETLEWIHAIIDFLKPYRFFLDDRMWEAVDIEWMNCLRKESVEKLLQIPSGVVQDHWPASLKEFIITSRSLSLPRDQADLQEAFPGLRVASLNNVLAQGMSQKKKHEIETVAAVINSIARRVGAKTMVDVGSGQGYLAQVLSFEHELSVIAIDASSHHGSITEARAKRIEKYYASKARESRSENRGFSTPKTVTCKVLSPAMLKDVSSAFLQLDDLGKPIFSRVEAEGKPLEGIVGSKSPLPCIAIGKSPLVLAGLHACGDLSVTMLRTFMECDEVKAVISIGCCYNLISEEAMHETHSGFPVSTGVKSSSVLLGRNARDLACQSAERWRGLDEAAGIHNFDLHAFRAAFQMVLLKYYPEIIIRNPAIGRQGKALRRKHNRRILESDSNRAESFSQKNHKPVICCTKSFNRDENDPLLNEPSSYTRSSNEGSNSGDRYSKFLKFCLWGLERLGLHDSQKNFLGLWKEAETFADLVGPYWTLRAALGPVLETALLLDRLLFLQEQGFLKASSRTYRVKRRKIRVRAEFDGKVNGALSADFDSRYTDRQKALDAAMNDINNSFGKGSVTRLGSAGGALVETFPSGCLTLDFALGGGLPRGRIVEVYGPESSGKTTLALHAMAEVQRLGGNAMLVDAEHAFDPAYSKALGVDVENLIVCQPDNGEMALEIADRLCRSGAVDLICIDSVSALTPRAEIEGEIGMQQMGLQARLMSQALRKMSGNASKAGCTLIFLNQIRHKIGVYYGNPEVTSGGIALKFFASVRLEIRPTGKIKSVKGDEDIGVKVRVRVQKSKVSRPYKQAEFEIMFGEGISKLGCVLDCADMTGVIVKKGSWYSYGDHRLGQGRDRALQYLKENPLVSEEIEKKVRAAVVEDNGQVSSSFMKSSIPQPQDEDTMFQEMQ